MGRKTLVFVNLQTTFDEFHVCLQCKELKMSVISYCKRVVLCIRAAIQSCYTLVIFYCWLLLCLWKNSASSSYRNLWLLLFIHWDPRVAETLRAQHWVPSTQIYSLQSNEPAAAYSKSRFQPFLAKNKILNSSAPLRYLMWAADFFLLTNSTYNINAQ